MIPVKDNLVDIDSLPGEEIEYGIGDAKWVMRTQASLYSDIITAIIREYSTNAYDAHVEADNPDPIEVTLPNEFSPSLVIQDRGTGMDVETFRKVYTQFGVSPKRGSNKTNGMLGYGSKSAVAYTTQFSVTSVKDGVKIYGVVKRKPDWAIVLKVVSTVKTDEPNGTRIEIPVRANSEIPEFKHKADEFFKFWKPGRVLVNGTAPVHYVGNKIVDGLYRSPQWNNSYVVMSNTPYRINNPTALFAGTGINPIHFVAYVDTVETSPGEFEAAVEFTPSREELAYTDHTKATLHNVVNNFAEAIKKQAKDELAAAKTHAEAYQIWTKWTNSIGHGPFGKLTYKGKTFSPTFDVIGYRYKPGARRGNVSIQIRDYTVEAANKTLFITGIEGSPASRHKAAAKAYAAAKGISPTAYVFMKATKIESPWVSTASFVEWEKVKPFTPKKPRAYSGGGGGYNAGRIAGSWDYITHEGNKYEETIPETGTVYWIAQRAAKNWDVSGILSHLDMTDTSVILVPMNRLSKFQRENPSVEEFTKYAKSKVVIDQGTLLSDADKRARSLSGSNASYLKNFDASKVEDPELVELIPIVQGYNKTESAYEKNLALASYCGMRYTLKEWREPKNTDPFLGYPLISSSYFRKPTEHEYIYINAVYRARKEGKNV